MEGGDVCADGHAWQQCSGFHLHMGMWRAGVQGCVGRRRLEMCRCVLQGSAPGHACRWLCGLRTLGGGGVRVSCEPLRTLLRCLLARRDLAQRVGRGGRADSALDYGRRHPRLSTLAPAFLLNSSEPTLGQMGPRRMVDAGCEGRGRTPTMMSRKCFKTVGLFKI